MVSLAGGPRTEEVPYSAARIGTACRLKVKDFHQDGDEATITLHEKGDKHRRIGLHFAAGQAITEYIEKAGLKKGPLFRAQRHSRKKELGDEAIGIATMYRLVQDYLSRLPGSMHEEEVTTQSQPPNVGHPNVRRSRGMG